MSEEFKPCPFCGADVNLAPDNPTELHTFDCYFNVQERYLHGRAKLNEVQYAWNRRAETGRAL